jgi:hypothetical protein
MHPIPTTSDVDPWLAELDQIRQANRARWAGRLAPTVILAKVRSRQNRLPVHQGQGLRRAGDQAVAATRAKRFVYLGQNRLGQFRPPLAAGLSTLSGFILLPPAAPCHGLLSQYQASPCLDESPYPFVVEIPEEREMGGIEDRAPEIARRLGGRSPSPGQAIIRRA